MSLGNHLYKSQQKFWWSKVDNPTAVFRLNINLKIKKPKRIFLFLFLIYRTLILFSKYKIHLHAVKNTENL